MPNETSTVLTPEQWRMYDEFCQQKNLQQLTSWTQQKQWPLLQQIQGLADSLHRSRAIHHVHRPEMGWRHHNAWLALRTEGIYNQDGSFIVYNMRAGDVLCVQHNWDRDVFATHTPRCETVSGYMLSGIHENMVGLFLPLFSKETILSAIRLRREQDVVLQEEWMIEESKRW